jgi:hypothetical protein
MSADRPGDGPVEPVARWLWHMRGGEMERAWQISDALVAARGGASSAHLPRHEQPVWDGTPVDGKRVLVRCYHGLGDTLQFIRYAEPLSRVAREVIVWAQPALIPLLRSVRGIHRLLPLHDGAPDAEYNVDVEVMELPHLFRSTLDTIPARVPYIHAPKAKLPGDGNLAVGLVWRAGDWDDRRSVPSPLLVQLGDIGGVTLHILQRGPALDELPPGFGVLSGSDDVLRTASVIRALDLVVTVDSMPAHLVGALGMPVWTLLHSDADWRWMVGHDDSPWYPTMRLFRQDRPGDWEPVIARVAAELRRLAASRPETPQASELSMGMR